MDVGGQHRYVSGLLAGGLVVDVFGGTVMREKRGWIGEGCLVA